MARSAAITSPRQRILHLGERIVDLQRHEIRHGEERTRLSATEVELLRVLAAMHGEPVTREALLQDVLGYKPGVKSRAVDHVITRLRKKLETDPADPHFLQTVYGVGYRLEQHPILAGSAPLPAHGDRFVGRASELHRLGEACEGHRLVSLIGAGGVGKTRLALAAAETWSDAGHDVLFVDLSEEHTLRGMLGAVASALGTDPQPGETSEELQARLAQVLRRRGALRLILDNLEQVCDLAVSPISEWLVVAPGLRVLGTSRIAFGIESEHCCSLGPLPPTEAAALLWDRAGRSPDELDASEQPALLELLEGLPLAIELAGARLSLMRVPRLLSRLEGSYTVLRRKHGPRRHTSLEQALAWSWDLLEPEEQDLLVTLAVFESGFTLEEAEEVTAAAHPHLDVLDGLHTLVSHHLVRRTDDTARFQLTRPTRIFARSVRDDPKARGAHRRWCTERARLLNEALIQRWSATDHAALLRLTRELVAAFESHIEHDAVGAADALDQLPRLYIYRVGSAQVEAWCTRALEALAGIVHADAPRIIGRTYRRRAQARRLRTAFDAGVEDGRRARAIATTIADEAEIARCDAEVGILLAFRGQSEDARARFEMAREVLARRDDPAAGVHTGNLGALAMRSGDLEAAERLFREAIDLLGVRGHPANRGRFLVNLANLKTSVGRPDLAIPYLDEASGLFDEVGDRETSARLLGSIAYAWLDRGELDEAEAVALRAIAECDAVGVVKSAANARIALSNVHLESGQHALALRAARQALADYARVGDPRWAAIARMELGRCLLQVGDDEGAEARLARAIDELVSAGDHRFAAYASSFLALARHRRGLALPDGRDPLDGDIVGNALNELTACLAVPDSERSARVAAVRERTSQSHYVRVLADLIDAV